MASAVDVGKREASEPLLSQGEIDQFMKGGAAAFQGGNQGSRARFRSVVCHFLKQWRTRWFTPYPKISGN
jgi:hypothetical protein